MAICDWWAELDAKVIESRQMQKAMRGGGKGSNFSPSEWAAAREKHKAKQAKNGRT